MKYLDCETLIYNISSLLQSYQDKLIKTINKTMVLTYFEIGKMIIEEEQKGKERAEYGKFLLNEVSKKLTTNFGKGFSKTNLKQMRQFYIVYSKSQTVSDEFRLSWSHYLKLMRINNENERKFYEIESFNNNWSLRELQIQFDTALYTRLSLNRKLKKF